MPRALVAASLGATLLASCTGGGEGDGSPGAPRCANPVKGPDGWILVRTRDVREGDHVGVRQEYRDPRGRRLFFLLGISGEVGEGLPFAGTIPVADGSEARLLGRDLTWALAWEAEPPCSATAVIGQGMPRSRFLAEMRETGIFGRRKGA